MFLVTGGAGFIGSNVVASLNEAGASDVVVCDVLGKDDAKWRNLAKRQVADLLPPAEMMAWLDAPQARGGHPHGRHFRHHRERRRPGDGKQFPHLAAPARLVHGRRARRSSTLLRRRPMATARRLRRRLVARGVAQAQADEPLRLEQAFVRSRRGRPLRQKGKTAAALGRPEILQRLRPERVSQGSHGERAGESVRHGQSRQAGQAVQVAPRRHRRRRPAARLHLCRRRRCRAALAARAPARSAAFSTSAPARRKASAT